jgi:hypothetical protein
VITRPGLRPVKNYRRKPMTLEQVNPWCDFCKTSTPSRYEACREPCHDFLNWVNTQVQTNFDNEARASAGRCVPDNDD